MSLKIRSKVNLKQYNTFHIPAWCDYFTEIQTVDDFLQLIRERTYKENARLIIGGGSNILFTGDFSGIVLRNRITGIKIVKEDERSVLIKAGAGEVWHDFVKFCIEKGYGGLENLSLIPGCVGASPMQNIGAYGVEIKEVFHELEAYHMTTGEQRIFKADDCHFGYRESVFKNKYKNQYLIASVTFRLSKSAGLNTSYGAISAELEKMGISEPGIADVSQAVINIRRSKLPDPDVTGNAGSFFKNPEVSAETHLRLKEQFPDLVSYHLPNGGYKLAAGWLIEQCGLKGYQAGGAAVHDKQALVLVNKSGSCTGKEVFDLSSHVLSEVENKFGVRLEREVNIV